MRERSAIPWALGPWGLWDRRPTPRTFRGSAFRAPLAPALGRGRLRGACFEHPWLPPRAAGVPRGRASSPPGPRLGPRTSQGNALRIPFGPRLSPKLGPWSRPGLRARGRRRQRWRCDGGCCGDCCEGFGGLVSPTPIPHPKAPRVSPAISGRRKIYYSSPKGGFTIPQPALSARSDRRTSTEVTT